MNTSAQSHSASYTKTTEDLLREFDVMAAKGLAVEEIQRRRKQYGANPLRETESRGGLKIFLQQFKSVVSFILVVEGHQAETNN